MRLNGTATRLRIYIGESDHWEHQSLYMALVELLRGEGLAGATVLRGIVGFGAHSRVHSFRLVELSADLPIVVEVVDRADRIERVLPRIDEMVREGLVTLEPVEVRLYRHRDLRELSADSRVEAVMTAGVRAVTPDTRLDEALRLLAGQEFHALPVVDGERHVVGIVTNEDFVSRGGLDVRRQLSHAAPPQPDRPISEIMRSPATTVEQDRLVREAAHLLVERGLKRVPVVDGEGRLVGMLSRLDILRAVAGGLSVALPEAPACPLLSDETSASQALQGPVPTLAASVELPDAAEPLLDSPFHLVFVVDPQGRLLGTLSAEDLVARLEPSLAPSRLDRLRGRGLAHLAGRTLAEFMRTGVYAVGPDMPLARVLEEMLSRKVQVVPVVDATGRPLGVITRDEMLRCAVLGTPAAG